MEAESTNILVIDDHDWIGVTVCVAAEFCRSQVHHAITIAEAESLLDKHSYKLFLLDYQLPEMTGIELADTLRRQYPNTPQIMITAYKTADIAKECQQRGMLLFEKPFFDKSFREDSVRFKNAIHFYARFFPQSKQRWQDTYPRAVEWFGTPEDERKFKVHDVPEFYRQMFCDLYQNELKYATLQVYDKEDAKEIVNEAFFTIWKLNREFTNAWAFKKYLRKTVKSRLVDFIRKKKREREYDHVEYTGALQDIQHPAPLPNETLEQKKMITAVWKQIESLPKQDRQIMSLYFEGKGYKKIAEEKGRKAGSVKKRIERAVKKMKNN